MVRLKGETGSFEIAPGMNFNSTMVRLKDLKEMKEQVLNLFQFHYGTIKRTKKAYRNISFEISIPLWYD